MSRLPTVSVCIPAYNAARFLPIAVNSVLVQEFEDFEVIVSDDASSDETGIICERFTDRRFRALRSEHRLGQSGNWNRCVELARGRYVILLHADDGLLPGFLQSAVEVLDANSDVGLVHCTAQHIDDSGRELNVQQLFGEDRIDRDGIVLRRLLLDGCVINPAGVLVRREAFEHAGRFTDRIVWGVDWHMWIRIALQAPVGFLSEPLALYREHRDSGTSAVMKSGRNARDELWAIEDVFELIRESRPDLYHLGAPARRGVAHRTWCFAEAMCQTGEMRAARAGLRNAARIWPGMLRQPKFWGLWGATFTGYRWFSALHTQKQRVGSCLPRNFSFKA
jgi:glycosyltransferase involved in cell wall biosynthesis